MEERKELLKELMVRHGDYLKRTAFILLKDEGLAEDLVQETFLSFYRHQHQYRGESTYKTYLYRILMNQIKGHWRKKKNHELLTSSLDQQMSLQFEDQSIVLMDLHRALDQLNAKYAQVLVLYYFNEFSIKEISEMLNLSDSGVKMRLKRARTQLGKRLEGGRSNEQMARSYEEHGI